MYIITQDYKNKKVRKMKSVLALDIGGTNIKYATVTNNGQILSSGKIKSPDNYSQLLSEIERIYLQFNNIEDVVCISCPSVYKEGKLRGSSFLSYIIEKDIVGDIEAKLNVKCYIENDGNCSVLGEYYFGEHSSKNLAAIVIGSGIGGGIIINDQLLIGANSVGGELGFSLIDVNLGEIKPYSIFGSRAGMSNFIAEAQKIDRSVVCAEEVFESNDQRFNQLVNLEAKTVAMQIINLQYIVDPQNIVIGGAISQNEVFLEKVKLQLNNYYEVLNYHTTRSNVYSSTHGNIGNLLGATVKYWRENE